MSQNHSRIAAAHEFQHARTAAWWRSVSRKLTAKPSHLRIFSPTECPIYDRIDRGVQTIELSRIVGSLDRSNDFNADFLPRVDYVQDRWIAIHLAYLQGEYLPPVQLYKFGDQYYVVDGHHRISVMRYHGQQYIEASVIELRTPCWN